MKRTLRSFLLILLLPSTALAQESFDKAKLDQYFDILEKNNRFMGSVALSDKGQVVYQRAIGYSDLAQNRKADITTAYRIGSISKTFTSVLVFKAIEAKKLSLDSKLSKFFPKVPNADKISISHLLQHRSGIHNFTDNKDYGNWNTKAHTESQLVDIIVQGGSDFEPDSKAQYSNSNYVLLSYILEKVYKKPYANLLQEQIVKPLGLKHTYLGAGIKHEKNEAQSYSYTNTWVLESETDPSVPLGAGAVVSTPADLLTFGQALFNGKLVSPNSLKLMENIRDGYGRGLFQVPFHSHLGFGHTGGIDGFASSWGYFPSTDIGLAITSNGVNSPVNDVAIILLSAIYKQAYAIPEFNTISLSSADLDPYLGEYSSAQIPLKITISKKDKILIAQATGQPSFPLEAVKKDIFQFPKAGLVLEFNPAENSFILKQGGGTFTFRKD